MKLLLEQGLENAQIKDLQAKFDRLCDEQEAIDNTGFGEVFEYLNETLLHGKPHPVLYPFTDDEALIKQALKHTGHGKDEAFCERFMKSYKLFVEGKAIQAKGMEVIASVTPKSQKQVGGWCFVPISILHPKEAPELRGAIESTLERDAQAGTGLFANVTKIEKEDEALDELLCVEAYNCKHSFTKYLAALKQFNVVGNDGAFLKQDFTQYIFILLKQCADIIKDNTDRPQRVKNSLNDVIAKLDNIPIWGLFIQILVLQGLCQMLESIDINEGQSGYDEVRDLHDWLSFSLIDKLMHFCFVPYGENDFKALTPLCEYLCTIEAGKTVQKWVQKKYFTELQPEQANNGQTTSVKNINSKPQKEQSKQTRGKGRPNETFKDKMIDDANGEKLKRMHKVLSGKKGKDFSLIILACIKKGWITKPTYTQSTNEFGDIGCKCGYNKYLQEQRYTKDELDGAMRSLD